MNAELNFHLCLVEGYSQGRFNYSSCFLCNYEQVGKMFNVLAHLGEKTHNVKVMFPFPSPPPVNHVIMLKEK